MQYVLQFSMPKTTKQKANPAKQNSSVTLDENILAALAYFFGYIGGFVVLLIEKENKFVRFHATQSIFTFLPLQVFVWVLRSLAAGQLLASPIWTLWLILVILLIIKAYNGEKYKLPIVGDLAEKYADQILK